MDKAGSSSTEVAPPWPGGQCRAGKKWVTLAEVQGPPLPLGRLSLHSIPQHLVGQTVEGCEHPSLVKGQVSADPQVCEMSESVATTEGTEGARGTGDSSTCF